MGAVRGRSLMGDASSYLGGAGVGKEPMEASGEFGLWIRRPTVGLSSTGERAESERGEASAASGEAAW
jgi:hypothetical protein